MAAAVAMLWAADAGAQLCAGSLGDPVVNITFGAGSGVGSSLSSTNYSYISQDCPNDGQYTVVNKTSSCFSGTWHTLNTDHTGNPNGYFMLVNASFQPGDFYKEKVTGLCGNTTYEFSAWVANVLQSFACSGSGIKPNLTFNIETTAGTSLGTYNTGDIAATNTAVWKQYGMYFTTPVGVSDVVVRITNNAPGGCGNDLALDDITFRPCGAKIEVAIDGVPGDTLDLCEGDAATYQFSASISNGYVQPEMQWQESSDGGQTWTSIAGATSNFLIWKSSGKGRYQYRLLLAEQGNINSNFCRIASRPVWVNVHALPKITMGAIGTVCEGTALTIGASAEYFDETPAAILWQTPAGGFASSESVNGTAKDVYIFKNLTSLADSGNYSLTVHNAFGCADTSLFNVSVFHKPVAAFTIADTACATLAVLLQSNATISDGFITDWQWRWPLNESASSVTASPAFAQPGTYPVAHWVVSDKGCTSDTLTKEATVNPLPVASFVMPEICLSDAFAQFTDASAIAGGSINSYSWNFGDATSNNSSLQNPAHHYSAVGIYPVTLTVTSAAGCVADTTQLFTVNGALPKAEFTLPHGNRICSADTLVLRNASSVDFGAITRIEIYWKADNDPTATTVDEEPERNKNYSFTYAPFITGPNMRFRIRYVAYSGISCVSETFADVEIRQSPSVVFDAVGSVCANAPAFAITQGRETSGMQGIGVYAGNGLDAAGTFSPAVAGAGNHLLQYTFTSAEGCVAVASQNINVYPQPDVNAGPDRTIIAGGKTTLQASASGNSLSYAWTPATALSAATALQPQAAPASDIMYKLTATSADGCTGSDEVLVKVVPQLYIPNAFTPNGDGLNDYWQVPYLESLEGAQMRIYNRYGQMVFQTKGGSFKWDGRFGGREMPNGAYVYMVDLKDGKILKGTIMLIR